MQGKGRYPNLTAEHEVSGYQINLLADCANVSVELMHDILFNGAELKYGEFNALYHLLSCLNGYKHYSKDYLMSPKLSLLDPRSHRTRYRAKVLSEAIREVSKYSIEDSYHIEHLRRAKRTLASMGTGKWIRYASYRHALCDVNSIRRRIEEEQSRRGREATA